MEFKVVPSNPNEDHDIIPLTIQSYEDLNIKLIEERKKLSSEVWKYYGVLFNGESVVNPHRYYCSLCLKDLHESVSNGFKVTFSSVHNVSITTATGNLKMHLFKGHNINTFPDSVKDRYDVSLVNKNENKKICINVDEGILGVTDDLHGNANVNYLTNNSFEMNEGTSASEDAHSLIVARSRLKESIENQMRNYNFLTILSEIWFNPIIATFYLKLSVNFVDYKWDVSNFILCYAPLQSVTSDDLLICYNSVLNKFHISKKDSSRIHIVCTKLVPQISHASDQELCVVFLTNKLISKEGLFSSVVFKNLLAKCLTILSSLNFCYFEDKLLKENSDFLQELAEVYFVTKFDEQNPLLAYSNTNELAESATFEFKYVMRTSVTLYLLKFITKNIIPISKCLESLESSHLCLQDVDINCICHVIKFLELFLELPDIFNNCNNTLIIVPALKNKIKEFCELCPGEDSVVTEIKSSIISHLDKYYPMSYLVKMACILDPSVREILDKDDACQLLLSRFKSFSESEDKNLTTAETKKISSEEKMITNGLASKKLKLFESLKPHYQTPEYEDKFGKEVKQYLQHVPTVEESEMPLLFWKNHSHIYPNLSLLAREYLGIPASCLPPSLIVSLTALKSQMDLIHANSFRLNSFSYFHNNIQLFNP